MRRPCLSDDVAFPDYNIVEINDDGSVGADVVAFDLGVFGDDLEQLALSCAREGHVSD